MPVRAPETQPIPRHTSGLVYRSGDLESSRTAVLRDLRSVPIQLLFPASFIDIEATKQSLRTQIRSGRWKAYLKTPSKSKKKEDKAFDALPKLFNSISKACSDIDPSAELKNNPTKTPESERSNSSRPDGYFLRQPATFAKEREQLEKSSKDFWEDIAIPLEYRKNSGPHDRADNERKIIWSMHHIMRNDPCRRFTYGITIEDADLRLWLSSRAATVVSEAFDFIEDHDNLIKLVSSLAFADPTSLGWDPTLRRKQSERQMRYEIDVFTDSGGDVETYTADKIISDFGAKVIQGRGTRVFRAKAPDGRTVVVKDVWQDDDRDREGDLFANILTKMHEDKDVDLETSRKLFLTVIAHGDVMVDHGKDHTLNRIMRATDIPDDSPRLQIPSSRLIPWERVQGGSVENTPHVIGLAAHAHLGKPKAGPSRIHHRTHYRIVFAELCQDVHQLHNLQHIFQALMDGTKALKLLLHYEFVHRDVSAGNILYSVDSGGMLADLEYAKQMSSDARQDFRTGTIHFMAAEVAAQRYLFLPGDDDGDDDDDMEIVDWPFKHNPLHDLESICWVAIWALFMHGPAVSSSTYNPQAQQEACRLLFPETMGVSERTFVITGNDWRYYSRKLAGEFQDLARLLGTAIKLLKKRYRLAERGATIDKSAFEGVHDQFIDILERAKNSSPKEDVQLLEDILLGEPPRKRERWD